MTGVTLLTAAFVAYGASVSAVEFEANRVAFTPLIGPDGGGVMISGAF